MEKHKYQGKTLEEAIEQAKIDLQEVEENLIIKELEHGERITDDTWDKLKKHEDSVVIFMSPKEISVIMNNYKEYLESVNKVS